MYVNSMGDESNVPVMDGAVLLERFGGAGSRRNQYEVKCLFAVSDNSEIWKTNFQM